MLLQREQSIHVWGKAIPGSTITVAFAKESKSIKAKPDSSWDVYLTAQKANPYPQQLTVSSGSDRLAFKNILIGDVWLCFGQSNMQWPMQREMHYAEEMKKSQQPLLRIYNPAYAGESIFGQTYTDSVAGLLTTDSFYKGHWQNCDTITIRTMSAVVYYFGKEVANSTKVPIGLIDLSIGGAPLETFIDQNTLKESRQFSSKINGDWLTNDALPEWVRERGAQNVGTVQTVPVDEYGKNHPYKPGFAYSAGIEDIVAMPIKGVILYQGESNAQEMERVKEYAALSKLMIEDYRQKWNQLRFPFYYVQLLIQLSIKDTYGRHSGMNKGR